ncbi:hypothetical protein AB0F81_02560 [Actinoplanes sp. NPDC024001]|uniref:hypothetical protein n=1 Tax=Actinoplanes sp. NPDC024001 TaxID=3154598 RepID=UPI0033D0B4F7
MRGALRLGVAAVASLVVAGLTSVPAAQAAAVPQATVTLSSGEVEPGETKNVVVKVTNNGPGAMKNVKLTVDHESYAWEKIHFSPAGVCDPGPIRTSDCHLSKSTLQPGESAEMRATLSAEADQPITPAGRLVMWPMFDGYNPQAPQRFSFPLTVGKRASVAVHAWDVPAKVTDSGVTVGELAPGEKGMLIVAFANRGKEPAGALSLDVQLPNSHILFDQDVMRSDPRFAGCYYSSEDITCSFKGLVLQPESAGQEASTWAMGLPVYARGTAKGRATGGTATVVGAGVTGERAEQVTRGVLEPSDVVPMGPNDGQLETDNFAALVKSASPSPSSSSSAGPSVSPTSSPSATAGAGAGSGGGEGGEDDPTLPITGPVATGVAATGAAVVVAGLLLFLAARRRRIVVVAPDDES